MISWASFDPSDTIWSFSPNVIFVGVTADVVARKAFVAFLFFLSGKTTRAAAASSAAAVADVVATAVAADVVAADVLAAAATAVDILGAPVVDVVGVDFVDATTVDVVVAAAAGDVVSVSRLIKIVDLPLVGIWGEVNG